MAIWEFRFDVIPAEACVAAGSSVPILECCEDALLDAHIWNKAELDVTCFDQIGSRSKSWSDEIATWTTVEGDHINVMSEDGLIQWISVYLDLRGSYMITLSALVRIAREKRWLFLVDSRRCLPPTADVMQQVITTSLAHKYVHNPEEVLRGFPGRTKNGDVGQW